MSQAVAAPITGDPIVVGGKSAIPTGVGLSRRAAIGALAIGPAAVAASSAANVPANGWAAALRRYRKAEAAYDAHLAKVWNPLQERLSAMCPAPPHSVLSEPRPGLRVAVTYNAKRPDAWMREPTIEGRRIGEKLSAEWAAWFIRYQEAEEQLGAGAVNEQDTCLHDALIAARDDLMLAAAPDAAAVLTKLEIMWDSPYEERQEENERLIRRDLRLLADISGARRTS